MLIVMHAPLSASGSTCIANTDNHPPPIPPPFCKINEMIVKK